MKSVCEMGTKRLTEEPEQESLGFRVLQEPWNVYQVEDGSTIKLRYILYKAWRRMVPNPTTPTLMQPNYSVNGQVLNVVICATRLRGEPTTHPHTPEDVQRSIEAPDLRYETKEEEWNEYLMDDGNVIRLKASVVQISRTSLYDATGERVYLVINTTMPAIRQKRT